MKNYFRVYCCLITFWFASLLPISAEDLGQSTFWQEVLSTSSVDEIAEKLASTSQSWPKIEAATIAPKWQMALINRLYQVVRKSFNPDKPETRGKSDAYLQIADALNQAGGYSNELLADSLYRLVIFRIAEELALSFENIGKVENLISKLHVPAVDMKKRLAMFANQDPLLRDRIAEIASVGPTDNIYVASEKLRVDKGESPFVMMPEKLSFSHLLANPSGLSLIFRMAQTEMLTNISLKAISIFIKNGGTLEELDPADVTRFEQRMKGSEKDYRYAPLSIRRLSLDYPLSLLQIYSDPETRKMFLRIALE